MEHLIVEIKASCPDPQRVRTALRLFNSDFRGVDHQIDTYFLCENGRLKLREGTIERALIHYQRSDQAGPKRSDVLLYKPNPSGDLKSLLSKALGVLTVVDKKREIHFLDNVKIHVDEVEGLGSFIEIEAIADEKHPSAEILREQCDRFMESLFVQTDQLLERSYSDMLLDDRDDNL